MARKKHVRGEKVELFEGRKIVRNKEVAPSSNHYFTEETEDAIRRWQAATSKVEQDRIYTQHIHHVFELLAQKLIYTYRIKHLDCDFDDLMASCVSFLYQTLPKFDTSAGAKAFSYFNISCRNFLFAYALRNKQYNYRYQLSSTGSESELEDEDAPKETEKVAAATNVLEGAAIRREMRNEIEIMLKTMEEYAEEHAGKNSSTPTPEQRVITGIRMLCEDLETLDLLNKKDVYTYLKEITGLEPRQLANILTRIRRFYRESDDSKILREYIADINSNLYVDAEVEDRQDDE